MSTQRLLKLPANLLNANGRGVDPYDGLPDRLIVYLWPEAGGTRFQFKFRPRFGIAAHTARSVVYDYYNPEARAVAAPTKLIVRYLHHR